MTVLGGNHRAAPLIAAMVLPVLGVLSCLPFPRAVNVYNNTQQVVIVRLDGVRKWSLPPQESVTLVEDDSNARVVAILDPLTCDVVAEGQLVPGRPTAVVINTDFATPPGYSLSIRAEDGIADIPVTPPGAGLC